MFVGHSILVPADGLPIESLSPGCDRRLLIRGLFAFGWASALNGRQETSADVSADADAEAATLPAKLQANMRSCSRVFCVGQ